MSNLTISYRQYERKDLKNIRNLIEKNLSEPYSTFTYHYFLHEQPHLCILAVKNNDIDDIEEEEIILGVIIGKISDHRGKSRGYIGMLAVDESSRGLGIGSILASKLVDKMISANVDEIVLETEVINKKALSLYEKLGFIRDKRLDHYYLNGSDAFRLKLWFS